MQRLRYWGALRAFLSPYFLRSTSRAAGEEATLLQLGPQLDVEVDQGPGDGVAQGAGLAGDPAAVEVGEHVVALEGVATRSGSVTSRRWARLGK